MLQLVGQTCILCRQKIESVTEGTFCAHCAAPVHIRCRRMDVLELGICPDCSAPLASAATIEVQRKQEAAAIERELRNYHFYSGIGKIAFGVLAIVGGVPFFLCAGVLGMIASFFIVPGGLALIVTGVAQLRLVRRGELSRQEMPD